MMRILETTCYSNRQLHPPSDNDPHYTTTPYGTCNVYNGAREQRTPKG
jgi:hypothetical protein